MCEGHRDKPSLHDSKNRTMGNAKSTSTTPRCLVQLAARRTEEAGFTSDAIRRGGVRERRRAGTDRSKRNANLLLHDYHAWRRIWKTVDEPRMRGGWTTIFMGQTQENPVTKRLSFGSSYSSSRDVKRRRSCSPPPTKLLSGALRFRSHLAIYRKPCASCVHGALQSHGGVARERRGANSAADDVTLLPTRGPMREGIPKPSRDHHKAKMEYKANPRLLPRCLAVW